MVRKVAWKYVSDSDEGPPGIRPGSSTARRGDELYDLIKDPWEPTKVALDPANVGVISTMRALLNEWMMDTENSSPVSVPVVIGRHTRVWINTDTAQSRW